jgi:hypothetical protein
LVKAALSVCVKELELIMDREKVFADPCLVPTEGHMYDIIQAVDDSLFGGCE